MASSIARDGSAAGSPPSAVRAAGPGVVSASTSAPRSSVGAMRRFEASSWRFAARLALGETRVAGALARGAPLNVCGALPPAASAVMRTSPCTSSRSSTSSSSETPSGDASASSRCSIPRYCTSTSLIRAAPPCPLRSHRPASARACSTAQASSTSLACTPSARTRACGVFPELCASTARMCVGITRGASASASCATCSAPCRSCCSPSSRSSAARHASSARRTSPDAALSFRASRSSAGRANSGAAPGGASPSGARRAASTCAMSCAPSGWKCSSCGCIPRLPRNGTNRSVRSSELATPTSATRASALLRRRLGRQKSRYSTLWCTCVCSRWSSSSSTTTSCRPWSRRGSCSASPSTSRAASCATRGVSECRICAATSLGCASETQLTSTVWHRRWERSASTDCTRAVLPVPGIPEMYMHPLASAGGSSPSHVSRKRCTARRSAMRAMVGALAACRSAPRRSARARAYRLPVGSSSSTLRSLQGVDGGEVAGVLGSRSESKMDPALSALDGVGPAHGALFRGVLGSHAGVAGCELGPAAASSGWASAGRSAGRSAGASAGPSGRSSRARFARGAARGVAGASAVRTLRLRPRRAAIDSSGVPRSLAIRASSASTDRLTSRTGAIFSLFPSSGRRLGTCRSQPLSRRGRRGRRPPPSPS